MGGSLAAMNKTDTAQRRCPRAGNAQLPVALPAALPLASSVKRPHMHAEREDAQMRGVGGVDGDVMRHSYKWAIKLSPRWVDGYYNLGNLLLATNQVEKAIERLQVAGVCPVCHMPARCSCV